MDNSRDNDLAVLSKRMNDTSLPLRSRRTAWKSFNSILAQVSDRGLVELRHSLIRARLANDDEASDKIELRIKDYVRRHHY